MQKLKIFKWFSIGVTLLTATLFSGPEMDIDDKDIPYGVVGEIDADDVGDVDVIGMCGEED